MLRTFEEKVARNISGHSTDEVGNGFEEIVVLQTPWP
jgi:hypothetical protein